MKRPPFWLAISAIALAVIAAALTALVMVPIWLHPQLPNTEISKVTDVEKRIALQQAQSQLQNETRATLLQSFAGLVLVAGALTTWRQVNINRHGQITERITRAVDQLAGDRMDVRVGGIFALERVALNSAEDRHIVTAIIATFVRTQAPWTTPHRSGHQHQPVPTDDGPPWAGTRGGDVQNALYVIARRPRPTQNWPPFLSFSDLSHARMGNRDWSGIVCQHSNLTRAWMPNARLDDAHLDGSDLRHALSFPRFSGHLG